jgi:hypothetical protein
MKSVTLHPTQVFGSGTRWKVVVRVEFVDELQSSISKTFPIPPSDYSQINPMCSARVGSYPILVEIFSLTGEDTLI